MANVKIGDLLNIPSVSSTDVLPIVDVGGDTTYKITVQDLANNLTEVTQSISASYALNGGVTSIIAGTGISIDTSTGDVTITNTGGGGGGSPGGSTQQIQYNNGGAFGGVSKATFDGTTFRATGSFNGSLTGTSSWSDVAAKINAAALSGPSVYLALVQNSSGVSFIGADSVASLTYNSTTKTISATSSFATTSSYAISSSFATTSSYSLTSSYATTSSYTISASLAQTASSVNMLVQNVSITGSLIVSGTNGAGIFSQGATLVDYINTITSTGSYMVWRAPFSCSVVGLYGYYVGGTSPQVNAARSGSTGYGRFTGSNLVVNQENVWLPITMSGIQNKNLNAGDCLQVIMSGSGNYQLAVQVDLIRKL